MRVQGLGYASLQGDVRFVDVLEQMGAMVVRGDDFLEVRGGAQLDGIEADMNAISDTAPTLAALAPFARRPVTIRNVAHVRLQESDRLHAVATELQRLGVRVREFEDGLCIEPSAIRPAVVDTYDDHRLAMSFALIGLRVPGIGIRDPECVRKTFPDYFRATGDAAPMTAMVIAIDGPAGAGKSTVSRRLAEALGYRYIDTGAMYRVIGVLAAERGIDLSDSARLATLCDGTHIEFIERDGGVRTYVGRS